MKAAALIPLLIAFPLAAMAGAAPASGRQAAPASFSMEQVLDYPFPNRLVAAPGGAQFAWVQEERGVRNIWLAAAPDFTPRQLTDYSPGHGEGQELNGLHFSADGRYLVYVYGGDPGGSWEQGPQPDPSSAVTETHLELWSIALSDGSRRLLGNGSSPAISPDSRRVAFLHGGAVWAAPLDGSAKAAALFFERGHDRNLIWSPDGGSLAFVSDRDDHSFIGIYREAATAVRFLAPSTALDDTPTWSPDGTRIAFTRQPGNAGAPQPILKIDPAPWSIWVADVASGSARSVWQSPGSLRASFPDNIGGPFLNWLAGDRLLFLSGQDDWPHLYSIPAAGGAPTLLTPGRYMVEDVTLSADRTHILYSANTGDTAGDLARRHLYLLDAAGGTAESITAGDQSQWDPVLSGDGTMAAFIQAGARLPPLVAVGALHGKDWRVLNRERIPADFPADSLVVPQLVSFKAKDGLLIHGELYRRAGGAAKQPAVIFVHGGPPRQMLLGWHYFPFYSNAYAIDQYLANHGYVVLSVDYRLSIGYGIDFHWPDRWGPTGASEYQDVLAAARFLQREPGVDGKRLGIWGSSYGGYLTALALARNSDIFKAGVDLNGVHDWSWDMDLNFPAGKARYEQGDRKQAFQVSWESSPDADVKKWTSPVLIVQGDDDRNVYFHEMIDLVNRLHERNVPVEQLVLPNETHVFQLHSSVIAWGDATAEFFDRYLGAGGR